MVYKANELLARLTHLSLWGVDSDGDLEFVGTSKEWRKAQDEGADDSKMNIDNDKWIE